MCDAPSETALQCNLWQNQAGLPLYQEAGKAPQSECGACPGQFQGVCVVRPQVLRRLSKTRKHSEGPVMEGGPTCAVSMTGSGALFLP